MFDVIVAGGGPSGLFCSYLLSKAGLKTLLVERNTIPNRKPCGGCLSYRVKKLLVNFPYKNTVDSITIASSLLGIERREEFPLPVAFLVEREEFDGHLFDMSSKEGTKFMEGARLLRITRKMGKLVAETSKGDFSAGNIVLATGQRPMGTKVALSISSKARFKKSPDFDVRILLNLEAGGYGWIFNKGEGFASTGFVSFEKNKFSRIKKAFEGVLSAKNEIEVIGRPRVYPIPFWSPDKKSILKSFEDGVFVVGDRGFFADAIFGEGIYYGLVSSWIVSRIILFEGKKDTYLRELKPLVKELSAAYLLSKLSRYFPKLSEKILVKSKKLSKLVGKVLRGEKGYTHILKAALTKAPS